MTVRKVFQTAVIGLLVGLAGYGVGGALTPLSTWVNANYPTARQGTPAIMVVKGLGADTQLYPYEVDATTGALPVNVVGAGGSSVGATGAAVPASATFVGAKDNAGNLAAFNVTAGGDLKSVSKTADGAGTTINSETLSTLQALDVATQPTAPVVVNGVLNGNGQSVVVDTTGRSTVVIQMTGAWTAIVNCNVSADGGGTYTGVTCQAPGNLVAAGTTYTNFAGFLTVNVAGFNRFQLFVQNYTAGASTVSLTATVLPRSVTLTSSSLQPPSVAAQLQSGTGLKITSQANNALQPIDTNVIVNGAPLVPGQAGSSSSLPVVIANDQSSLPVTPKTVFLSGQAEASIACTAITNAYVTLMTQGAKASSILMLRSGCDAPISVSFDGGVTTHIVTEAFEKIPLDLHADSLSIISGALIQIKYPAGAPTTGTFRIDNLW